MVRPGCCYAAGAIKKLLRTQRNPNFPNTTPHTPNATAYPPNATQCRLNIGCVKSPYLGAHVSCRFHVVCVHFICVR